MAYSQSSALKPIAPVWQLAGYGKILNATIFDPPDRACEKPALSLGVLQRIGKEGGG